MIQSPSEKRSSWPKHHQFYPKIMPSILNHKFQRKKKFNLRNILTNLRRIYFLIADYGNTLNYHFQKRPSKKLRSKPLKEGSLQKHPKSSSSHPSKPQVGHRTAKEMSSKPIEGESKH